MAHTNEYIYIYIYKECLTSLFNIDLNIYVICKIIKIEITIRKKKSKHPHSIKGITKIPI